MQDTLSKYIPNFNCPAVADIEVRSSQLHIDCISILRLFLSFVCVGKLPLKSQLNCDQIKLLCLLRQNPHLFFQS